MSRNSIFLEELEEISQNIKTLAHENDIRDFILEMHTQSELETLSKRWRILKMLKAGITQREIAKTLGVSLCKVTRGAKLLKDENSAIGKLIKGEQ